MKFLRRSAEWFSDNIPAIVETMRAVSQRVVRALDRLVGCVVRLAIIGVIANVVVHFCPEFGQRFPVIYGWFDGWTQFVEFAVKGALAGINALFRGNFNEFYVQYHNATGEILSQFANWLNSIHF